MNKAKSIKTDIDATNSEHFIVVHKHLIQQVNSFLTAELDSVVLIYIFGSTVNGFTRPDSDVDIGVLTTKGLDNKERWDMAQNLAIKLKKDVDLVDLKSATTIMQEQIIRTGVCIYGDEHIKNEFEMRILSMYLRLQESRAEIVDDIFSRYTNK